MLADDRKLDTLKPHGVTVTAKMGRTEVGQLRAEPLSQSQWNSANIDTVKYVCVAIRWSLLQALLASDLINDQWMVPTSSPPCQ